MAQSTEVERFWSKVQQTDTCWLWTDTPTPAGYGKFGARRTMVLAHRYAYELLVGPIPEGLELDHLCFVKLCVNPAHLEPVTGAENTRRYWASRTACRNGHPYSTDNTYWYRGVRECRVCQRAYEAGLRDRRRERSGKGRQRHYPGLRTGSHSEASCPKCRGEGSGVTTKNYCGQYRRHVWVVANVSQVIQFGADEVYVCYRCRKPRRVVR